MEIRYFDGEKIVDVWDMVEQKSLPIAIEVCIWLVTPEELSTARTTVYDMSSLLANAREYRQTVSLPMAELSRAGAMGGAGGLSISGGASSSAGGSTSGASSFGSSTGP